ncbi:flavin monoamine oxidase family protein [Enterovirga rhinocerotis]|uniref:Tryptophan 2-monooxygenase n=1 Tax=Enterovirga rhinocerotis TaxID=1339210 RepID=A0A4R7C7X9_9HYPH|nr:NAD(P)/FAD-dependent oxidoreductase [Enterovirga rhinocerotis]TDR94293.1 monoamine oxidase [Enterovirga rhinocerotis]
MIELRPVASPRLAPVADEVEVAIVGAGAAGIAAARRCRELGLTCAVLEARDRVGGRAVTVPIAGQPIDLGAHWLHAGDVNPLVALGLAQGEDLTKAEPASHLVVDGRIAGPDDRAAWGRAFETVDAAITAAAESGPDRSLGEVFPPIGVWREPMMATFALISGRPLSEVSTQDFPSDEFGNNWFVAGGYGAYLARLAEGLPIALGTPVRRIDRTGRVVALETDRGRVVADRVIVTVPVPVLAAGAIDIVPALPPDVTDALCGFLPGTYEHVVLNWPGSPFQEPDRLVKVVSPGASFGMMSRLEGSALHYLELDHATAAGRDRGDLADFARSWLAAQFGERAARDLDIPCVTDWVGDPWSRCAWAVVPPGRASDRLTLSRPVDDRLLIVGEASSKRMWGTVGGAWEEGARAVDRWATDLRPRV